MRASKQFVKESLYNIEPLDAGTFIEYELKEHFRLKTGDARALASYHKELYKAYAANKGNRQAAEENGLPEWYEMTERGGLRFLSGILADYLAGNVKAFYTASSYFFYEDGVYRESEDMAAAAQVRERMVPRTVTMQAINDTVGQWKITTSTSETRRVRGGMGGHGSGYVTATYPPTRCARNLERLEADKGGKTT